MAPTKANDFIDIENSDDFKEILTVCREFKLDGYKMEVENYLMKEYAPVAKQTLMEKNHVPLLQLAKDFNLHALYNEIFRRNVDSSFTENILKEMHSRVIKDDLKYNIVKKCIRTQIVKSHDFTRAFPNGAVTLEVISIFHFLDLYFHEKRILDYALSKDTTNPLVAFSTSPYDPLSFFKKNEINDVLVKVDGKELFVNSTVLSGNSPVFKATLESAFKEGLENVIVLPGKRAEDIIELFTSLKQRTEITEHNAYRLLPLSREYEIDWLQNLIQDKLLQIQLPSDRIRLKYLNLSHDMDFLKGKEHFVNSLCESFIQLQTYKEFNDLKDETKLLVALRRSWYVCKYTDSFNGQFYTSHLVDEGLPSIFSNVNKGLFKLNETESARIRGKQDPFFVEGQNWLI